MGRDTTVIGGRERLNFSTYNYLGLNGDPRVNAAAALAMERFGTSASSSRIVGGERPPHRELERALAALHRTEDAVAFVSGYMANLSIVSTVVGAKDAVVMDRGIHNSIAQGAKLSGATIHTFPHNDWARAGRPAEGRAPSLRARAGGGGGASTAWRATYARWNSSSRSRRATRRC